MKILVLFKTHLDVGFTDFAANIVQKYMTKYIPDAIRIAREIADSGRGEGFTWTTGSWLIWQYLRTADAEHAAMLEDAIARRYISWHGLPATMHSEAMSGDLLDYGISLSAELDARFGRHTIGAKMTDVPGHTQAIVPHLADAGIRFLHIGINPASCPVDVPFLFRWKFEGREIAVMYESGDYGGFRQIPNTDTYVCFAHTGDNLGPQSAEEIYQIYDAIHADYPEAEVVAADLTDVAHAVMDVWDTLPVLTREIGDTWIHGVGTDPQKVAQYRALLRFAKTLPDAQKRKLYEHILLVPEHTWGLDEKKHLHENRNYRRDLFDAVRNDYSYKKMELSWAEQRKYITDGVAALDMPYRAEAEALLREYHACPQTDGEATARENIVLGNWKLSVDESGAICDLRCGDAVLADAEHRMFAFSYDEYSAQEVWNFQKRYLRQSFLRDYAESGKPNWAIDDFGKVGLENEVTEHSTYIPHVESVVLREQTVYVTCASDDEAVEKHGCPKRIVLALRASGNAMYMDFYYQQKYANRVPEALWLEVHPLRKLTGISKLGYVTDPTDVVSRGNRELHATDGCVQFEGLTLETEDAPLVSVDGKHVYGFENRQPNPENGVYINLYNNQWGTNFPMWTEGNRHFRFVLRV